MDTKDEAHLCAGCLGGRNCDNVQLPRRMPAVGELLETWEISVPCRDSFVWAIALAYMKKDGDKTLPEKSWEGFADLESVVKKVSGYNPFIDRHLCFTDENNLKFIRKLDEDLLSDIERSEDKVDRLVEVASDYLQREIVIYDYSGNKIKSSGAPTGSRLILFKEEGVNRFSITLEEEDVGILHQDALTKVFNECNELDENVVMDSDFSVRENQNIPVSLLKRKKFEIAKSLYKLPPFIFAKLRDLGFITDPMTKEEGKSAFYYASMSKDFHLLFTIYLYAANDPHWWRLANVKYCGNIQKLKALSEVLQNTETLVQTEVSNAAHDGDTRLCVSHIQQLKMINNFRLKLTEMLEENVVKQINEPGKDEKAKILKNIILDALKIYNENFNALEKINPIIYSKYSQYFYYIDFLTTLLFLDYSFSLKQALNLEKNVYEKFESSLCRVLFFRNVASTPSDIRDTLADDEWNVFIFQKRLELQKDLEEFIRLLENFRNTNTKTPPPDDELDVLRSVPELKDHYSLDRLWQCANAVEKSKWKDGGPTNQSELHIPVVKRFLQVLGETVKPSPKISTTVIKSLLVSAFPLEVTTRLRDIREYLSHYDEQQNLFRIGDENHFLGIKEDVTTIKETLEHVRYVDWFLIRKFIFGNLGGKYVELTTGIMEKTDKKIEKLNSDFLVHFRKNIQKYETHFQNHYDQLNYYFHTFSNVSEENERIVLLTNTTIKHIICLCNFLAQQVSTDQTTTQCLQEAEFMIPPGRGIDEIQLEAESKLEKIKAFQQDLFRPHGSLRKNPEPMQTFKSIEHCFSTRLTREERKRISEKRKHAYEEYQQLFAYLEKAEFRKKMLFESNSELPEEVKKWQKAINCKDWTSALRTLKKTVEDANHDLKRALGPAGTLSKPKCKDICTIFDFEEEEKTILEQVVKSEDQSGSAPLKFLDSRITGFQNLLNQIGIVLTKNEDNRDRFLSIYGSDEVVQAAFELFIFDCMNVMTRKKVFPELCTKANGLLAGTNLRNLLAHGNPLFDAIVFLAAEPYDLICEFLEKSQTLLADQPGTSAMLELYSKRNDFPDLVNLVRADEVTRTIREMENSQEYAKLIEKGK